MAVSCQCHSAHPQRKAACFWFGAAAAWKKEPNGAEFCQLFSFLKLKIVRLLRGVEVCVAASGKDAEVSPQSCSLNVCI